jgi:hypothetical protein
MPKPPKDDSPNRDSLDEFIHGARQAAALKAAVELEVFTRIAEGHRSLPAFLRVTGLNERGARLLLDALSNIGLLTKSPFEYSLTPTAENFLVKGKPAYYGDAILAQLAWDARGNVTKSVRTGKPISALLTNAGAPPLSPRASATWIDWQAIVDDFAAVWTQLDVSTGGKPGVRAVALGVEAGLRMLSIVRGESNARLVVVDAETEFPRLKSVVDSLQLGTQLEWVAGDYAQPPLPAEPFDVCMVDSITESLSLETNIGMLHRAIEALAMGGQIVLRAAIADDDRLGPQLVPLLGLDILIGSAQGDVYTQTEYRGMLEAAGFFEVKPIGGHSGLLSARRALPPPPPPAAATVAPDFIPPPETLN